MIKYKDYKRNHVVLPGREEELDKFINSKYKGRKHKLNNSYSSNSEDALTWSCFDIVSQLPKIEKIKALDEIIEHSFTGDRLNGNIAFSFKDEENIIIEIGKTYLGHSIKEETEIDVAIETNEKLIFFEAKLYSSVSLAGKGNPYDQIAKKIRVGLDNAAPSDKEFFFIFLDIAPRNKLYEFSDEVKSKENAMKQPTKKWKSVWWFNRYKYGWKGSLKPLESILDGINTTQSIESISNNMGWLTWADLFKITLRGTINGNIS